VNGEATQDSSETDKASKASTTLSVEIFGSTYGVRSDREPEHLEALAALVDQKMRKIAGQTVAVETSRIAILAALNLADELVRERDQVGRDNSPMVKKAHSLLDQLEDVLTRAG